MNRLHEKIVMAIAWALPRRIAYWCAIRVMAHATTGQWGHLETPALLATDALKRWHEPRFPPLAPGERRPLAPDAPAMGELSRPSR